MAAKENITPSAKEIEEYFERMKQAKAPAWIPEPNTTIIGAEVIGMELRESGWGQYPCIIYRLPTGEAVAVHAFHTILRERLKELGTMPGKKQNITYLGKVTRTDAEKEAGKNEYHDYYAENFGEVSNNAIAEDFHF